MKALIGVTPGGAAAFVSDAYEGSISDIEITKKCGFLDNIIPGDGILAGNIKSLITHVPDMIPHCKLFTISRSWVYN